MELTALNPIERFAVMAANVRGEARGSSPGTNPVTKVLVQSQSAQTQAQERSRAMNERDASQTTVTREAATSSPALQAHYKFEYEGKTSVMKLQDSKGALIYQVPSKGRLVILQEEQRTAQALVESA